MLGYCFSSNFACLATSLMRKGIWETPPSTDSCFWASLSLRSLSSNTNGKCRGFNEPVRIRFQFYVEGFWRNKTLESFGASAETWDLVRFCKWCHKRHDSFCSCRLLFAVRQPSSRLHCGVHELLDLEEHIYLDVQVRENLSLKVSRKSRSLALARVQVLLAKLPVLQRHGYDSHTSVISLWVQLSFRGVL